MHSSLVRHDTTTCWQQSVYKLHHLSSESPRGKPTLPTNYHLLQVVTIPSYLTQYVPPPNRPRPPSPQTRMGHSHRLWGMCWRSWCGCVSRSIHCQDSGAHLMLTVQCGSMTATEKVEQLFTGRQNSEVPGKTLARLIDVVPKTQNELWGLNMAMHFGQGAAAAVIRGVASYCGFRGPFTDFMFVGLRLAIDQTLENWTGVGAPPW